MTNKELAQELTHSLRIAVDELVTIKRIVAEHLENPNASRNQGLVYALDQLREALDKAGVEI